MQGTGGGVRPRLEVCQVGLGVSGEHPIPALRGKMQSSGGTHVLAGDSALVGGAKKESGSSTLGVPSGLQFESSAHPTEPGGPGGPPPTPPQRTKRILSRLFEYLLLLERTDFQSFADSLCLAELSDVERSFHIVEKIHTDQIVV